MPFIRQPRKLPVVLSPEEVARLLDAAPGLKYKWKDYRANGRERAKVMTLAIDEFIRRFLIHVLPGGFHRIRSYGLFAKDGRAENIARARQLAHRDAATEQAQRCRQRG